MDLKALADKVQHEVEAVQGNATKNVSYVSQNTFADEAATDEAFARSVEKLLNVNGWSALSSFTADFLLHDQRGQPKPDGKAEVGDHVRVTLPGPTPENWVRVIDLTVREDLVEFTVQPCADPGKANTGEVAHFFTDEARSTFRVEREGTMITASEIGQDEAINNQQPEAGDRALVNTAIAEGGWLFYQKVQWKTLTDYLVHL